MVDVIEPVNTRLGLDDKVAVVTGGTRGLGLAIASKLCDCGVHVVVTCEEGDADADRARLVLTGRPGAATVLPSRVHDEDSMGALLDEVVGKRGRLDILVHCTTSPDLTTLTGSAGHLAETIAHGGRVVVVAYAATPVEEVARALAVELAPSRVTANAVVTSMVDNGPLNMDPDLVERLAARSPSDRLTTPADVADAVVLLCADEAAWIQGQVITVDGGLELVGPAGESR